MNKLTILILTCAVSMTGCTINNDDLTNAIAIAKTQPGGEVSPLPEPYEYNKVGYTYNEDRNPFIPSIVALAPVEVEPALEDNGIRPDLRRKRESLEGFELGSLQFVGIFILGDEEWYLVGDPTGVIHKVRRGNYLGFNNGIILSADKQGAVIQEIVPREDGGYIYRDNKLAYRGSD